MILNKKSILLLIFRCIITGVFVSASYHKILDPIAFAKQVARYEILPDAMVYPFSFSLPFWELLCALLIWVPKVKVAAYIGNLFMMLLFIVAIASALLTGKEINCGCFQHADTISVWKLVIDLGLLLIIIYGLKEEYQKENIQLPQSIS